VKPKLYIENIMFGTPRTHPSGVMRPWPDQCYISEWAHYGHKRYPEDSDNFYFHRLIALIPMISSMHVGMRTDQKNLTL